MISFCLQNKLIMTLLTLILVFWGIMVAPFGWSTGIFPRDPVPVDAIPDIGENQQIVFTGWSGRSPRDIEDQITYPLTVSLLGIPGVKTIRSFSYFGFSTIYVIFDEKTDFYWSRSRILEKLSSLPDGTLPAAVSPTLGPDATALGQVFWYTLEGMDKEGSPTGGWDLHELRSIQDWTVRYALMSAGGVAEVASIGGFVREYQVDVDPDAMRAFGVTLQDILAAVRASNLDTGAGTIEVNRVEYVIRGLGLIGGTADIENSVIRESDNVPIRVKDVAAVSLGPAARRGALDKGGAEAVGGVVVVRFGENPLKAIDNIKAKIREISPGLPKKTLADGTESQVRIVPFYDRTGLIYETLGTLNTALIDEILVTIIVIIILMAHIRSSLLISGLLPLTILLVFIAMKLVGVDANIVALSGIAIAIGTIVDMGIIVCENIIRHLAMAVPSKSTLKAVYDATSEVAGAVLTAIATTIISFLPVFTMTAAEGKLFRPLAYTKTFALLSSVVIALAIIPPFAHFLFSKRKISRRAKVLIAFLMVLAAITAVVFSLWLAALVLSLVALYIYLAPSIPARAKAAIPSYLNYAIVITVGIFLARHWRPLGYGRSFLSNFAVVAILLGGFLFFFTILLKIYEPVLRWSLAHRRLFLSIPLVLVFLGVIIWLGFGRIAGFLPERARLARPFTAISHVFPGLGNEFMPDLDEGSFLYMPTTMPHASIGEALDILRTQDIAFSSLPEIESVVGKTGRVDSPLDPAPVSMFETIINYKPEYVTDKNGRVLRFRYDKDSGKYPRNENGDLIEDGRGRPYRNWRDGIDSPDDIWKEILRAGKMTGTTSAPKLQPVAARLVMLQSGMRAPMGVKIKGPDLDAIEKTGLSIEKLLREVPQIDPATIVADRIIGKPYIEIDLDREKLARYGISVGRAQEIIEAAAGGMDVTATVEGRERYSVRVRYKRELRNSIEGLQSILVPSPTGTRIPLAELADIRLVKGPMVIKSEDTFLVGYVIFDKRSGYGEVEVVEAAAVYLESRIESGDLEIPAGVSYAFAGSYENQVRSAKRLRVVLPLSLLLIFIILYLHFKNIPVSLLVFSGIFVAWSGGFIMLWLYGNGWFLDFSLFGVYLRDLFQIRQYNLSVAVWVGFLALFGIASDDGVMISTYLDKVFREVRPSSVDQIREATVRAGKMRVRAALMTSATTILALIPVLTSTGRGSDIMVPMAIPSFGGMSVVLITIFLVPVLYSLIAERRLSR
ncbi:MAG: efflux RND transporter permease subunit [Candidatus Krumholzibacteriota bacterium]|nr:efflux RND transporter permease subunit [Candidatus Krumholzibacteriota bacterium]